MNSRSRLFLTIAIAFCVIEGGTQSSIATPSILSAAPNLENSPKTLMMTEAQKLKIIRESLMAQKHMEPSPKAANQQECDRMLRDLLAGERFKAIEPFLIVESEDDPRIPEAWQACRYAEAEGDEVRAQRLFNGVGYLLGDPPYRLYHINDNEASGGNWSDVVYGEPSSRTGRGGWYSSLSLDRCEITSQMPTLPGLNKTHALVEYHKTVCVISFVDKGMDIQSTNEKVRVCGWKLFRNHTK